MEEFITACPRNCYSTCSFKVQVENNKIRRILPYSGNLATPEGLCIKGLSYIERQYSSDRIIHPLLKNSDGSFSRITMQKGFIFDSNRCVGCGACSAACILENGWEVHPRNIYCYNSDVFSTLPIINLFLACNHCEKAVCLEGCPSAASCILKLPGLVIVCLFLTGELLERILFYIDFQPVNINNLIYTHLIIAKNEKKRG